MVSAATGDRFLGGRVIVRQMQSGFRAGLDAVMLAAAVPADPRDEILELGAGAGTASLCLARRLPDASIVGVEFDTALVSLANDNAKANGAERRVRFIASDVFDLPKELRRDFAHVFCNPPFHDDNGEISPDTGRDMALRDRGLLGDWMKFGLKRTASGGTFTTIVRADRLSEALARLPERGISIFPLWPRDKEPAKRVILQVVKGSRAPSALLAGMVLHNADGTYAAGADAILRDGASLALDSSRL
jgi:tRNA1(Val) A37 N6-methylase TrmN6